jgi:hypothetical protein
LKPVSDNRLRRALRHLFCSFATDKKSFHAFLSVRLRRTLDSAVFSGKWWGWTTITAREYRSAMPVNVAMADQPVKIGAFLAE